MEHRWGRRISLEVPVRLILEAGEPLIGRIENVSISGAFVRTARSVPVWARLEVELGRPCEPGGDPECIIAHVIRRTKEGVGIEWHELAPRAVRALLPRMDSVAARLMRAETPVSAVQAA